MNRRQLIAMWIGIIIVVAMCICPPWIETTHVPHFGEGSRPAGYRLIFSRPTCPRSLGVLTLTDRRGRLYDDLYTVALSIEIDVVRLVVQEAAVAVVFGGLFVSLRDRRKD